MIGAKSGRQALIGAAVIGVSAIILFWGLQRPPENAYDDAFITYRYAQNFRQGLGLVYNPGEWVLGTTTPFFALLIGIVGFLVNDLIALGHWLSVLAWIATALGAMALFWQDGRQRSALIGALLIAFSPQVYISLGMETALVVALMMWVAWAWLGGRKLLMAFLAAALLLTRQDSALWLILLGLEVWRREKKLPWRDTVLALTLTLPWFVFAFLRYGSPLPNSATAKIGQLDSMAAGNEQAFWQSMWLMLNGDVHPVFIILLLAAVVFGLWTVVRYAGEYGWIVLWTVVYVLVYSFLRVSNFSWYFVPPILTTLLIAALGLGTLAGDKKKVRLADVQPATVGRLSTSRLPFLLSILALLLMLLGQIPTMVRVSSRQGSRPAYWAAAEWLAENTPIGSKVATIEIGVLGYQSKRDMVDTMGLVTQDLTRHQVGWVETLVYALNVHQPEIAVTLKNTAWTALVNKWWFTSHYEPVESFGSLTLYRRLPQPARLYTGDLDFDFANGLNMTGIELASRRLEAGREIEGELLLNVTSEPSGDYHLVHYLVDAQNFQRHELATIRPFDGLYASQKWQVGDELAIPIRYTPLDNLADGAYWLGVEVLDAKRNTIVPLADRPEESRPDIWIALLRQGQPPVLRLGQATRQFPSGISWENGLQLESLEIPDKPFEDLDQLPVLMGWHVTEPIERNLTAFVHLVDSEGRILSQLDRIPGNGRWPTATWLPGENVRDIYELELSEDIQPGCYGIRLGFYDAQGNLALEDNEDGFAYFPAVVDLGGC